MKGVSDGRWIPVLGLALLLHAACASQATAAEAPPKTHAALLDEVAGLAAADLLRGGAIPARRVVRIASPIPGDTLGFLAQRVLEQLRNGGTEVRLVPSRATATLGMGFEEPTLPWADSTDLQINLQVGSAGVSYVRAIRKFPFGVSGYERVASMRVGATLVDLSTRQVLWARSSSAQRTDVVRRSDLSYAQSGSGGLNPGLPRAGGGTRLLEPLIVVGVVAGLVVLFYSNRN